MNARTCLGVFRSRRYEYVHAVKAYLSETRRSVSFYPACGRVQGACFVGFKDETDVRNYVSAMRVFDATEPNVCERCVRAVARDAA